jgi:hypothetical protein
MSELQLGFAAVLFVNIFSYGVLLIAVAITHRS